MNGISADDAKVDALIELLKRSRVPAEDEPATVSFPVSLNGEDLADAYLAVVAICHQTSPLGERGLRGYVAGSPKEKRGWDYLKEKFLLAAMKDPKWVRFDYWASLTPNELSALYRDESLEAACDERRGAGDPVGLTLNRVNERASLLNDLGSQLVGLGYSHIREPFERCGRTIGGGGGFLNFLGRFEAYNDPVMKKSLFFVSLAKNECGWPVEDADNLYSPIDYHELRGHLRIGTLSIGDAELSRKVRLGLALTDGEDTELRREAQNINHRIGTETGLGSSVVHYLLWNVFRNCCPRPSDRTHCFSCGSGCELPDRYKAMPTYEERRCVFSPVCSSAGEPEKVLDPPYVGHYY